jgi:hypothetical protein
MTSSDELDQPVDFAFLAHLFPFIGQTYAATPAPLQSLYQAIWEAALDSLATWLRLQAVLRSTSAAGQRQRLAAAILPLTDVSQAEAAFLQVTGTARYAQRQQARRNLETIWRQLAGQVPLREARHTFGRYVQPCLLYLRTDPGLPALATRDLKCLVNSFASAAYLMDSAHPAWASRPDADAWEPQLMAVVVAHVFATEVALYQIAAASLAWAGEVFAQVGIFFAVEYPTLPRGVSP